MLGLGCLVAFRGSKHIPLFRTARPLVVLPFASEHKFNRSDSQMFVLLLFFLVGEINRRDRKIYGWGADSREAI